MCIHRKGEKCQHLLVVINHFATGPNAATASENHHQHHHRAAIVGRSVPSTPRCPRLCACLQWSAGVWPVSLLIWSSHLPRGHPGLRLQEESGGPPRDELTWTANALWAETLSCSLAMCPKMEMRLRLMMSKTEDKPVWACTSSLHRNCCQDILRIRHWHFM